MSDTIWVLNDLGCSRGLFELRIVLLQRVELLLRGREKESAYPQSTEIAFETEKTTSNYQLTSHKTMAHLPPHLCLLELRCCPRALALPFSLFVTSLQTTIQQPRQPVNQSLLKSGKADTAHTTKAKLARLARRVSPHPSLFAQETKQACDIHLHTHGMHRRQ